MVYSTTMTPGFTFLETLIALSLIALLALIALPQYQTYLSAQQQKTEIEYLLNALNLARQQALLQGLTISVCPDQTTQCGEDWSQGFRIVQQGLTEEILIAAQQFSGDARILLKTFPEGREYLLQFTASGNTAIQNGSFYYCPKNRAQAKRIVFNQAGRSYVTEEGAVQACVDPIPQSP